MISSIYVGMEKFVTRLTKDNANTQKHFDEFQKMLRLTLHICFASHRRNFVDYCILLFSRGTDHFRFRSSKIPFLDWFLRISSIPFSQWLESQNNELLPISVWDDDIFGPREILAPVTAFRAMLHAFPEKDFLSTLVINSSSPKNMALAIKLLEDNYMLPFSRPPPHGGGGLSKYSCVHI